MRLVFWQQFHSPHQFLLLDALTHHPRVHSVDLILEREISPERRDMHWREPQYQHLGVHVRPSPAQLDLLTRQPDAIHIFSGLHSGPTSTDGLKRCLRLGRPTVVMAETGDWNGHGPRRYLRLALHVWRRLQYGRHIRHILAIGQQGVKWYRRVGYPADRLTAFAYFVAPEAHTPGPVPGVPQVLFVGRALAYKGGDLLLQALAGLRERPWQATLVTQGPQRQAWEALRDQLGLQERVEFVDFEVPERVLDRMAAASMLVLPNTADEGWGAVVNEALFQGTPVICTTRTGAQDMLCDEPQRGQVVAPTEASLRAALARQMDAGHPTMAQRQALVEGLQAEWSGPAAARRLVQALSPLTQEHRA